MENKRREEIAKQKTYLRNKEENRKRVEQETMTEMRSEYARKMGQIVKSVTKSPAISQSNKFTPKQIVKDPFNKGGAASRLEFQHPPCRQQKLY